ncbi:MAG: M28 family peptidase [Eubacteriales bacterium]|nr:M28 family peptidase [Eubacteriales bacterium]
MNRTERIALLAQKNITSRRHAMKTILEEERLPYRLQEKAGNYKNPLGVVNYIIEPEGNTACMLFSAHYDAVAGSCGANDNAASVCILIDLALELRRRNIPARFVFFDGEENKLAGSRHFIENIDRSLITAAINLDLCGFGDAMTIYSHGKKHGSCYTLEPFMRKEIFEKYNGQLVNYLPKSDDASLISAKIPTLAISVMPRSDVAFLKALATYNNGILGKPPEYGMMIDQMEISTTMHGGYRDDLKWLENASMDMVYNFLLEAVGTKPETVKKRWGIFNISNKNN